MRADVTEYGAAYLHGKTMRERAMALIHIAHPKFRPWLLAEAKSRHIVYADQVEMPFTTPVYPKELEKNVVLKDGSTVRLRPLRITDEPALKEMFYGLSEDAVYHRFFAPIKSMPHEKLQDFLRIDYESEMAFAATAGGVPDDTIVGVGRYCLDPRTNLAEAAFLVADEHQGKGIGSALLGALTEVARKHGLHGFTAEVLADNRAMLAVFHHAFPAVESRLEGGIYSMKLPFVAEPASSE